MNRILDYLKQCHPFYVATSENDQPHVRPFGAVCEFEEKLYIVTNKTKNVYKQLMKNGKIEICGYNGNTWIRIEGEVKLDGRREAREAMMKENYAALSRLYNVDDNLMAVFNFVYGNATIYSFKEKPEILKL
jgi:uncharacterized pyridoxamine 5'-phosphate oxidase family protein